MIDFLKKRSTAVIIVVIAGILFTLYGARRSLNREAAKVERLFYEGIDGETAPDTYLDNLFREAKTVYSVASKYLPDGDTAQFRESYNGLQDADTISGKYDEYKSLMYALDDLTEPLGKADVTDAERKYLDEHVQNMLNISRMLESSPYNASVDEFERKTLGAFPANVLRLIVRPNLPARFQSEREG